MLPELLAAIAVAGGGGVEEDDVIECDGNRASGEEAKGGPGVLGMMPEEDGVEQIHGGGR